MRDTPPKVFHVYITASRPRGVLYVGMTSDLAGRAWQHRERVLEGFTKRCERAMKKWRRDWKVELIEKHNPTWRDLFADVVQEGGFEW